jgi:NAD+-dependent protein deacetylase sirtuin 2
MKVSSCAAAAAASSVVDMASLARFIMNDAQCRSVVLLTGAGVSVSSGIPDFRSPGGLYDTLNPDLLTATPHQRRLMEMDPTHVVSWDVFRNNALPYLEVRRPFILGTHEGRWRATIAHRFAELLHLKTNKLTRVYTQNIDGLDRQCRVPNDRIVHVHGTLSKAACEGCGAEMDHDDFCEQVRTNIKDIYDRAEDSGDDVEGAPAAPPNKREVSSTPILCPSCHMPLVKPTTVLFGRSLPAEFYERSEQDLPTADLLIIAGTSLVVSPANSLVYRVPESTIRVVVNRVPVGEELGIEYDHDHDHDHHHSREEDAEDEGGEDDDDGGTWVGEVPTKKRDFFAQGDCDEVFLDLIRELGWLDDLMARFDLLPPRSQALLLQK